MTSVSTELHCACGAFRMSVSGAPIASVECCCSTCREAGERFEQVPGAPRVRTELGVTPYALYRKDRVELPSALDGLQFHRLTPESSTRRFVTACCSTPMFLEFAGGHWLSIYGALWSNEDRPSLQLRTMTASMDDPSVLPDDVPNAKRHTLWFYRRLFAAWVQMRLRAPKIHVEGELHA